MHPHTLTRDATEGDAPSDKGAEIDIDNDGAPDFVVQLRGGYPGGRSCEAFYLGVLTAEKNDLDYRLTKLMPSGICGGTTSTPFTFEGEVYIEGKYSAERPVAYHQINQLKNGKLETICRFEVRLMHELGE